MRIGSIHLGAAHEIAVQSMCATRTQDIDATVEQAEAIREAGGALVRVAVDNPTTLFLNAFREALQRKDIFVGGSAIDIDDLREPPEMSGAQVWVTDRSAPLYEIVDPLLKWSRNGYAETLLWTMSPTGAPANEAAGLAVLRSACFRRGRRGCFAGGRLKPPRCRPYLAHSWRGPRRLDERGPR